MYSEIVSAFADVLGTYHDPFLMSKEVYNNIDDKYKKLMYDNGEIIQKEQKMSIQYSLEEVNAIQNTHGNDFIIGHIVMASVDTFIVNTIKDILDMIDGEDDASINELLCFGGSKIINPKNHGKFIQEGNRMKIYLFREDPEQFDPIFAKYFHHSVIIDSDYYLFDKVDEKNLYLIDDNVLGNLYFFKNIDYNIKTTEDTVRIIFEVNVEIFKPWLEQIKKFTIK